MIESDLELWGSDLEFWKSDLEFRGSDLELQGSGLEIWGVINCELIKFRGKSNKEWV